MVGNREIVYFCKRAWYFMILVIKIWKEKRFAFELHCTWYMLWFVEWCTSVTRIGTKLYCMKQLPAILDLTNHLVNTDGQKVCFRDNIRWIRVSEFGYYHSKNSHSESDTRRTVNLLKSRTRAATDSVQLPVRTVNKVALKSCKAVDLSKQLHFVSPACQDFYEQIISQQASDIAGEVHNNGNNAWYWRRWWWYYFWWKCSRGIVFLVAYLHSLLWTISHGTVVKWFWYLFLAGVE